MSLVSPCRYPQGSSERKRSNMRSHRVTLLAALAMILMSARSSTAADLYWQWSFTDSDGIQEGYFVTDGGPYSSANPVGGTYNILNFIVTSSPNMALGSITATPISTGGVYDEGAMPGQGFFWSNGMAQATAFFRDNQNYTNGSNFYETSPPNGRFLFYAGGGVMLAATNYNTLVTLSLQAVPTPVPEPSTYALSAIGITVFGLVARRRQRSKKA